MKTVLFLTFSLCYFFNASASIVYVDHFDAVYPFTLGVSPMFDIDGDGEVMTQDLGKMTWDNAKNACKGLGDGWRLPTKDELKSLYENKDKIDGFHNYYYWSSTEGVNGDAIGGGTAWAHAFSNDDQSDIYKIFTSYVLAVRDY